MNIVFRKETKYEEVNIIAKYSCVNSYLNTYSSNDMKQLRC